jgi:Uri superfamily endonuclease
VLTGARRLPSTGGTYLLVMQASDRCVVEAGRLGERRLPRGWYCYVGSAFGPGGLAARCGRHLRQDKRLRWHIDYLRPHLRLAAIWYAEDSRRMEHEWARALDTWEPVSCAWPGFGASDCRCVSHLWHSSRQPSREGFRRQVGRDTPIETFEE